MRSTSTIRFPFARPPLARAAQGFTLVELLVGLAMVLFIAAAVGPLWVTLEGAGASEADRTVQSLQGRVAVARFERDLRLASAAGCPFAVATPILEASTSQIVFLTRTTEESPGEDGAPLLVEWEIAAGVLMRRWGSCPASRPLEYRHSLYLDHKTMLEDVGAGSSFAYVVDGEMTAGPISGEDLGAIGAVILDAQVIGEEGRRTVKAATTARVAQ